MALTQRLGRQRHSFGPFYVRTQEGDWGPYSLADIRSQHAAGNLIPDTTVRDAGRNLMLTVGDLIADAVDQTKAGETAVNADLDPIVIEGINGSDRYDTTTLSSTSMSVTALPGHLEPVESEPLERRWQPPVQRPPSTAYAYAGTSAGRSGANGHANGYNGYHGYDDGADQRPAPRRRRVGSSSRKRRRGRGPGADPAGMLLLVGGLAVLAVLLIAVINHGRSGKPALQHLLPQQSR